MLGDFRRFVEIRDREEKVSANRFLRFGERTIHHSLTSCTRDDATAGFERMAVLHFALSSQSVVPGVPLLHQLLAFLSGYGFVHIR